MSDASASTPEASSPNAPSLAAALQGCEPIYLLPKDDVAGSVISPALGSSASADVMIGFFASQSLAQIAPGLAAYLSNTRAPLRLIVSPYLTEADQAALAAGGRDPEELAIARFIDGLPDADQLARHALACLAWLIDNGRLQMKIALMRNALFHPKVWLFRDGADVAALHGSANMTGAGLARNREQLSLARAWSGDDAARTCARLDEEFTSLWGGGDDDCIVLDLPTAIERNLLQNYKSARLPDEEECLRLWRKAHGLRETPVEDAVAAASDEPLRFEIPEWLNYRTGDYAHQGRAVDAWRDSGWRGILEMCTGAGKTLTAMVGAKHLADEVGPLLIVVSAPYTPLVRQWCGEISLFGLQPVDLTAEAGPKGRERAIANARRRLRFGLSPTEVLVVSNDTLSTQDFLGQVAKYDGPKLLIGDECHNLGAASFISNPPPFFEYRLGLSATPMRQYDDEGTDALFGYFGPPCFSFLLEDAIGNCLTPYDYHVHFVALGPDEMATWRELSAKIAKLVWKLEAGIKDDQLNNLFLKRRRVLETAAAKLDRLDELLTAEDVRALRYTLIYATDKDPRQLESVNATLGERGIAYHQLTYEETGDRARTQRILERFQAGSLQVLTAKRVLDEGINVPQITRAFVLASTTVKRQWVQRRGRLLRTCKAIGKTHAIIHDIVALPPEAYSGGSLDGDAKKIVNGELDRVWEFARLSRNGGVPGGPFTKVEEMRALVRG
jgi:superfamily II DNA or RNA helicase